MGWPPGCQQLPQALADPGVPETRHVPVDAAHIERRRGLILPHNHQRQRVQARAGR